MRAIRLGFVAVALIGTSGTLSSQLAPDRPFLVSATYWGGSLQDDANAVAVDPAGNVYIAGTTSSGDFPKTVGTLPAAGSTDVFVSKFDAAGMLVFSTVFGGSSTERVEAIAIDSSGNIVVGGDTYSADLPLVNPIQPAFHAASCSEFGGICPDGFVARLDPTGQRLLFSTYLGNTRFDSVNDVAVDSAGNMYVAGFTESSTFEGATPHRSFAGTQDAFIAKIPAAGGAFSYFTYLGGTFRDSAEAIAVDTLGNMYVTGSTSSQNFPIVNPIQAAPENYSSSAFVTKLDTAGNIAYSTYLSGQSEDGGIDIAVDLAGAAHVVGTTSSTNFPTVNAQQGFLRGPNDVFVAKLHPSGSSLEYSTYLGGNDRENVFLELSSALDVAVDALGQTYVTGATQSSDFPVVDAFQPFGGGACTLFPFRTEPCPDAFISKLDERGRVAFSTPMGGGGDDRARGVAATPGGIVYVVGMTRSTDFPVRAAWRSTLSGASDGFIATISTAPPACQLPAPVQLAPSGGIFNDQPTFSWEPVAGAEGYAVATVDLGRALLTGTPSTQILGTTSSTSLIPAAPLAAGDYGWFVVASNAACGRGQPSSGMAFTLPGTCPVQPAVQTSPVGGALVNNPIRLEWTADGPSIASLFVVMIVSANGQLVGQYMTTERAFTAPTLASGDYAWFVFSWNSTCGFTASGPASFRSSGMVN